MKTVTVAVLHRVGDFRDITQPHRSTLAITDDHGQIFLSAPQLVADLHLPLAPAFLHAATRTDRIGIGDRPTHFVESDPVMRQRVRVQLDTHCRQRAPPDRHLTDPLNLGNFLREDRGRNIVERAGRQIRRAQRQRHDRSLRRIGFTIRRVARHAGRQLTASGVDRRLHVAGGGVDVAVKIKFQDDADRALPAIGRNVRDARDRAQRPLQRSRDTRRHCFGAGPGQRRTHADRRKIYLRQRCDRQQPVGERAHQHDRDGDQRTRNRASNKWTRKVHPERLSTGFPVTAAVATCGDLARCARRSKNR